MVRFFLTLLVCVGLGGPAAYGLDTDPAGTHGAPSLPLSDAAPSPGPASEVMSPWSLDPQPGANRTDGAAGSHASAESGQSVSVRTLYDDGRYRDVLDRAKQVLEAEGPPGPEQMAEILELAAYAAAELGLRNESTHLHELAAHRPRRIDQARINLIQSLAQLQLRHHAFNAARQTVSEGIRLLQDADSSALSVPAHVHAAMYEMAARVRLRLLFELRAKPSEPATSPETPPMLRAAKEYQRRALTALDDVESSERGSVERDLLHNSIDFARLRGDVEQASRLARQARQTASVEGDPPRLIRSIHHQSLVARDRQDHQRALNLLDEAERIQQRTGETSLRALLLSERVHVAVELGDRRIAHRAMTKLIGLAEEVPEPVVRRASVAYASVFDPASDSSGPSLWHLLALATAVTVVIQTVGAAAHRHYRGQSFRGQEIFEPTSDGHDESTAPSAPGTSVISASAFGAPTDPAESGLPGTLSLDQWQSTRPASPLQPPDDLNLSWLAGLGISIRPDGDPDPRSPSSGAEVASGPQTLEDFFREALAEQSAITCYHPDGKKAFDLPMSAMVKDHVVKDRFAALDLSGQTLITYRYTRPQRMVVIRERDGRLHTTELPSPISAVPIARIESASNSSERSGSPTEGP